MGDRAVTMYWPGMTLEVTPGGHEVIVNGPEADPDWKAVDQHGHGHFWIGANRQRGYVAGTPANYPTLRWVAEPCTLGHGDDCDSEGHWECQECGDTIKPATRHVGRMWVEGGSKYRLTIDDGHTATTYEFGEPEWRKARDAMAAAAAIAVGAYQIEMTRRG